jgi:hypothetical protein
MTSFERHNTNPSAIAAVHQFKAKLVRLHTKRVRRSVMETSDADIIAGESPTQYHLIRKHQRRETSSIRNIRAKNVKFRHAQQASPLPSWTFFGRNTEMWKWTRRVLTPLSKCSVPNNHPATSPPMTHHSPHKKYTRDLTQEGKTEPQATTASASNTTERLGTSWGMISVTFSTLCF